MKETKETKVNVHGIGFTGLLTIVFITLKLLGYISWSWIWVLSPLWINALITVLMVIVVFVLALFS